MFIVQATSFKSFSFNLSLWFRLLTFFLIVIDLSIIISDLSISDTPENEVKNDFHFFEVFCISCWTLKVSYMFSSLGQSHFV